MTFSTSQPLLGSTKQQSYVQAYRRLNPTDAEILKRYGVQLCHRHQGKDIDDSKDGVALHIACSKLMSPRFSMNQTEIPCITSKWSGARRNLDLKISLEKLIQEEGLGG